MDSNPQPNDEAVDTGLADFATQEPQSAPESETPEPPSPPINFAEPEPPRVLTLEQALALQAAQAAQEAPQPQPQPVPRQQSPSAADVSIDDGIGIVEQRDGSVMLKTTPAPETAKPEQVVPERLRTKVDAEIEAGRRTVERHRAAQLRRPRPTPSEAEIKAQGTNTPVFRPGQFREYAGSMVQPGQTTSKDAGMKGVNLNEQESLTRAGY